ncbi:MAG: polysaccharide lyase family protein [Tepidisphaeraceae bacterium]
MRRAVLILALASTSVFGSTVFAGPVQVMQTDTEIRLSNGLIEFAVSRKTGQVTSVADIDASAVTQIGNQFYWDANAEVADPPAGQTPPKKGYYRPTPKQIDVPHIGPDRGEVIVHGQGTPFFPFDVEYHFVLLPDTRGLYAYVVFDHPESAPKARLYQTRFVLRTAGTDVFQAWTTGTDNLVPIPTAKSVRTLTDATFLLDDGTVKTKYQNSVYWADAPAYGVIGSRKAGDQPGVRGVWMIEASPEYHNGGPIKQGQTVHDDVLLRVLQSVHFGASPVDVDAGEHWQKVYGPFLLYVNHAKDVRAAWDDVKTRRAAEVAQWPYAWVDHPAYAKQRGIVSGRVQINGATTNAAQVILSDPTGEWSAQAKGYSYWTRTDDAGRFTLGKVVPGAYSLHIRAADEPTEFAKADVVVRADGTTDVGTIEWTPERHGRRLWQIGTFDRSAHEFRNGDDSRDFQMFARYPTQFPSDVDFIVGRSDPAKDWNYAHWSWYAKQPSWRIHFDAAAPTRGKGTLTIGVASAQPTSGKLTDVRVTLNGKELGAIALPKTGTAGYRGGTQDSPYHVLTFEFDAALLKPGANELTLRHADGKPFPANFESPKLDDNADETPIGTGGPGQVMYDALRLEVVP